VEIHILAAQARVLMWVGLAWLAVGLWLGYDPLTVAWRATLGAVVAMWMSGWLLRTVVGVINDRMVSDLADRQTQAENALRAATRPAAPAQRQTAVPARPGASSMSGATARPAPSSGARPAPAAQAAPTTPRPAAPAPAAKTPAPPPAAKTKAR
jgi:hypothetical protein